MQFVEWAGTIGISAATAATVTWAGAKALASKWMDYRFATRLEAVKLEGAQQLETAKLEGQKQLEGAKAEAQSQLEATRQEHTGYIERVKFERSNLLDRSVKLNQREFEIIPNIWNAATDAHNALMRMISRWQEGTNLHQLSEARFEAFLADAKLRDFEKDELRAKPPYERTSYYSELQGWQRLNAANETMVNLNRALAQGTIFLQPETHERIEAFADKLRAAFQHFRNNKVFEIGREGSEDNDPVQRYRADGESDYQALATYLRQRYWTKIDAE